MHVLHSRSAVNGIRPLPLVGETDGISNAIRWRWWGCSALAVVLGYLPVLTASFGRHNDYLLWACDRSTAITQFPETWQLMAIGRPLGAILLNLQFTCLGSLQDFLISRWFAMGVTLVAGWFLADHLNRRVGLPLPSAVCASACIFLLPASQLFVSWVTNFVPGTLTVLVSLVAYRTLDADPEPSTVPLRLQHWRRFLVAEAFFMIALLIYPPSALFVLVPAVSHLVFSSLREWPQTRRRLVRDIVFVATGMLAYFAIVRYLYLPFVVLKWPMVGSVTEYNRGGPYEVTLAINAVRWYRNLRDVVLVSFAGPLDAVMRRHEAVAYAKVVIVALLFGGTWRLWLARARDADPQTRLRLSWVCQACLAGVTLFVLSEVPAIVAQVDGLAGYRVVFPAEAMVALLVFAVIPTQATRNTRGGWRVVRSVYPVAMLLICVVAAHRDMSNVAANALFELNCFRRELATLDLRTTRQLRVICPLKLGTFVEQPLKMDLRFLGTHHDQAVACIVDAIFQERGLQRGGLVVSAAHADAPSDTGVFASEGMRTLDLNRLVRQH